MVTNTLTTTATVICLIWPLSTLAVPVIDPGLGDPPNENQPDTDSSATRPNGVNVADSIWAADDFELSMRQQLGRVTFWAYLQVDAAWTQALNYRISIDDGTGIAPAVAPYKDETTGKVALGSNVGVVQDSAGTTIYHINNQAFYRLNQYSFDLGGIGLEANTPYWLVLNLGPTTPGQDPNATQLLWAYNNQPSGARISADGITWPIPRQGGVAFELELPIPIISTLPLFAVGLLSFGVLRSSRKDVSRKS